MWARFDPPPEVIHVSEKETTGPKRRAGPRRALTIAQDGQTKPPLTSREPR
jgi:hypothetical protein